MDKVLSPRGSASPVFVVQNPVILIQENDQATGYAASAVAEEKIQGKVSLNIGFRWENSENNSLLTYCCRAWNAAMPSVSGKR